jgi:hypothetical protein
MERKGKSTDTELSATPYEDFRGTELWRVVEQTIKDIVENDDLVEKTRRDYIVGYICKKLQVVGNLEPDQRKS